MSEKTKNQILNDAESLAPWFEVEFTLRILGKVILHYVWPPKK